MSEPSQEPTHPVLIVTGPPRDGDALALESLGFEKNLGSGPDCHLRLQAGNVDFAHALIVWEGRGVLLSDLGSAAGTYVNGEKIATDHVLQDGDRICLGPPGSKQSVKLLARIPAESSMPGPIMLAPEKDPFGFGDEPPALDLGPLSPPAPEAAAPPAIAAPPPPVIPPLPAPPPPPMAAERAASGITTPAVIFDTPVPAPGTAPPSKPRRPGPDVTELPSIEAPPPTEGEVAPEEPQPRERPARVLEAARRGISVPPVVWISVLAAGLAGVGVMAWMRMRPPLPALSALAPPNAGAKQSLVISGTGFAAEPSGNTVRVGAHTAEVTAATVTQVTVTVPAGVEQAGTADLPVTVETQAGRSNPLFLRVRRLPRGLKLVNDVAMPGSELALVGENLDVKPLMVQVASIPADLTDVAADRVGFRVPSAVPFEEGRSVPVVVQVGADSAPALQLLLGRLPLIAELQPRTGRAGDRVTIRGRGFDPQAAGNAVTFGAESALVVTATETEIVSIVPHVEVGAGQLDVPVTVRSRGSASAGGRPFTMRRPSAAVFVPHFFPAPVPEDPSGDRVFVSTALGPVLLLAGRDDAPSPAERAARAAASLNAAFAAKAAIGLRETPPAVVSGPGDAIVAATAADAAAYAPPLVPAGSGRPSPRALAAHWTAVLQDMQALFVDRQRPVRVVQSSPRGKVLLELFAEGERLFGAGAGVPTRLVEPLPSSVARAFREMTLGVPVQTQAASAAAAVTGTWQGIVEEDGVGQRPMQLRLEANGTRLAGAMTSRSGKLGMDIPVHDLAWDKGVLTFRTTSGAAARRYRATLQGATLTGTIHATGASEPVIGRFTLRYTE